jgi:hypothetical protein
VSTHHFRPPAWWVLACSGLSPVLLTTAWLVAEALQRGPYDPVRQTVSVLSGYAGTDRWIVTGALYAVGACYVLTALGLSAVRRAARLGLFIAGLSAIGIAVCPEPAHGTTTQHAVCTVVGEIAIAIWPAFVARGRSAVPLVMSLRFCLIVTAVSMALLGWLLGEVGGGSVLGLAERLVSSIQMFWPFVVALTLRFGSRYSGRTSASIGGEPNLLAATNCD